MNFRSTFLENLAAKKNKAWNIGARKKAAEYYLHTLFLPYNTLLFNCKKMCMELMNYQLYTKVVLPLFDGKTYEQYLIILMVQSLANVILQKVWCKLIILRQKLLQNEENCRKQQKTQQEKLLFD